MTHGAPAAGDELHATPPDALLFDLDGVIADVSQSYRQAIIRTAATFGATIDAAEVAAAKAAGDANNDWQLTHRLLQQHGVRAELADVTRRFEDLYQGTPGQPGLWQTETLIPGQTLFECLSRRLPLGIVTGRPRQDAVRFLQTSDIDSYFAEMVCMEDAPAKPDPAPVRLLLDRLGVGLAWLIGDTPDDMRAARAAEVVPLGVVARGDDVTATIECLREAGAARILANLDELEALLP